MDLSIPAFKERKFSRPAGSEAYSIITHLASSLQYSYHRLSTVSIMDIVTSLQP